MRITTNRTDNEAQGFILPSILIISLGVLIIALAVIQSSTSIQSSIANLYYNHIANEAAEAGMSYAAYCLKAGNNIQTWGPAVGKPNLTQSTDCYGNPSTPAVTSLTGDPGIQSTFSVGDLQSAPNGQFIVSANGSVNHVNGNLASLGTFSSSGKRIIGIPSVTFSGLTLGYYYYTPFDSNTGAFYAVRQSDGTYKTAGINTYGSLGIGNNTYQSTPQTVLLPDGVKAKQAVVNTLSQAWDLFFITTDNDVYATGINNSGQLGDGTIQNYEMTPVKVNIGSEKAVSVASQGQATFVITQSGKVLAFGDCGNGKLGIGSCSGSKTTAQQVKGLPTPNPSDPSTIPSYITSDALTVYLMMQGGQVYGWGRDDHSQLGDNSTNDSYLPKRIGTLGNSGQPFAKQIVTDGDTLYVVDSAGNCWVAGRNDFGEAGFNHNTASINTLTKITTFPSGTGPIVKVASDQWTAIFLTSTGQVLGAGLHNVGEIGNNTLNWYTDTPQMANALPNGVTAKDIYNTSTGTTNADYNYTTIIGSDNKVYGMGSNYYGQLGLGNNTSPIKVPTAMQTINGSTIQASYIVSGLGTTIVATTTGAYYSTGNNAYGQLGNGNTTNSNTPIASKLFGGSSDFIF